MDVAGRAAMYRGASHPQRSLARTAGQRFMAFVALQIGTCRASASTRSGYVKKSGNGYWRYLHPSGQVAPNDFGFLMPNPPAMLCWSRHAVGQCVADQILKRFFSGARTDARPAKAAEFAYHFRE
ncbi:MAG: hypothetical protein ABSE79_21470 [Terriglobia bacterium]|jgi:hypothetical protein